MNPNDKAYQAAISAIIEDGPYYGGSKIRESMAKYLAEVALPAAYAAQFPTSEDYRILVNSLRDSETRYIAGVPAADALEAVLAERDGLQLNNTHLTDELEALGACLRREAKYRAIAEDQAETAETERDEWKKQAEICRDRLQATEINLGESAAELHAITQQLTAVTEHRDILWGKKVDPFIKKVDRYWEARWRDEAKENNELKAERDALLARLAPVDDDPRHLTTDEQKVFHSALRRSAKIKKPVEDEALVEIAAKSDADFDGRPFVGLGRADKDRYLLRARTTIAAIRPHIEAEERERCAKDAEGKYEKLEPASQKSKDYKNGRLAADAAIRRGK